MQLYYPNTNNILVPNVAIFIVTLQFALAA